MRFTRLGAAVAAVSLATASVAQTPPAEPEFTAESFRSHVSFLADDKLEGRNAGERGYDLGALYVATRFEALGLKPATPNGWYQPVPFIEHRLTQGSGAVTIGGTRFATGQVTLSSTPAEAPLSVEAPVVFAGFGIDAPGQGFDDYRGLDVRGKFVAVLTGVPKGTPSEIGAHLNSEKRRMAEKRGAIGLISIRTRVEAERRPWAGASRAGGRPSMSWVGPDGQPYVFASGLRARATLGPAAAQALFAGAARSLDRIMAEADRPGARPRGFALTPRVKVEQKSSLKTLTSPNVLAILPGSDPALAGEYVVLMAHLDHLGIDSTPEGADAISNGAMDNATGVATMLEVARAMAESPNRPRRSILFAAVTAEEDGLLGSQYLARNPAVGGGKMVGVVNLDMPVLLYDFTDVIAFGAEHSTLGPIVARAGARMNVSLTPDPLPQEGLFTRSDHYNFVREGIPSVFLMTGFAGQGREKFTGFLSTHYHKVSDDLALPINWQAGAKFARINYLIAREIADGDRAPLWYQDSFFGQTMAPGQEKAARPTR